MYVVPLCFCRLSSLGRSIHLMCRCCLSASIPSTCPTKYFYSMIHWTQTSSCSRNFPFWVVWEELKEAKQQHTSVKISPVLHQLMLWKTSERCLTTREVSEVPLVYFKLSCSVLRAHSMHIYMSAWYHLSHCPYSMYVWSTVYTRKVL